MSSPRSPVTSILIVENDLRTRRYLRTTLARNGFHVLDAATAIEGLRQVGLMRPDLIILDLDMPDGSEFARQLRKWAVTPILALSRESTDTGEADDYLTKPFNAGELLSHIHSDERFKVTDKGQVFCGSRLRVDTTSRKVYINEIETHLSPLEYKLLLALIERAGKVVSRDHLLRAVWGPVYGKQKHYLHVYMRYLRQKIERDPAHPQYLITEPGVGYRLRLD